MTLGKPRSDARRVAAVICSCLCCCLLWLPYRPRIEVNDHRHEYHRTPRPLPEKRPRRLTDSSPSATKPNYLENILEEKKENENSNAEDPIQTSPFLKLIPELRMKIYKEVLSGHTIHIRVSNGNVRNTRGRMAHSMCNHSFTHPPLRGSRNMLLKDTIEHKQRGCDDGEPDFDHAPDMQLLSLPSSCRQMYV